MTPVCFLFVEKKIRNQDERDSRSQHLLLWDRCTFKFNIPGTNSVFSFIKLHSITFKKVVL